MENLPNQKSTLKFDTKLILFLSVDIINSTKYKNSILDTNKNQDEDPILNPNSHEWVYTFTDF